jgi:hypothetical protein
MRLNHLLAAVLGIATALASGPALAGVTEADGDGDQRASFAELTALYPDLGKADFVKIDADSDGFVTDAEWDTAVESGLIDTPAG